MRKALIVGINYYEHGNPLYGCVEDARAVNELLEYNGDEQGTTNFDCSLMTSAGPTDQVERGDLKDRIEELFKPKVEIALFYFSGHGHVEATGGYLLASDSKRGDEGVSLAEVVRLANSSPADNKVIILDSCHSGTVGNAPAFGGPPLATLAEGLTVLSASTEEQYAFEENGRGVFTGLFADALRGGAANLTGDITPGSVYAHIDQSLGAWAQRPVFKTNVQQFVSLRKVQPAISLAELRRIPEFFPKPDFEFPLDPSYEPELKGRDPGTPPPNPVNTAKFAILQKYNRLNLLVPVGAPHMWHAAMHSKACKLTALGQHYRRLAEKRRL